MNYSDTITYIDDDFDHKKFPEKFSNQIYISSISKFERFRYQSNFSIKYVAQGTDHYTINDKYRTIKKGQFLIINEGDFVEAEKLKNINHSVGVSIFLDNHFINSAYKSSVSEEYAMRPETEESEKLEFYNDIISDDRELQEYFHKILMLTPAFKFDETSYLDIIKQILDFKFRFERRVFSINAKKKSTQLEIFRRVSLARDYLVDNTDKSFKLNELSEVACLSKFFLIKKFKEVYGQTPHRFHTYLRVKKAIGLLNKGNSVSETAFLLGFSSIHYFSNCFKGLVGQSPINYVRKLD